MNIQKKRYGYVAVSFLMLLLLGIAYAWSIFIGPLEQTYGWSRTQTSLAFTILMVGFSLGGLLMGILVKRFGYARLVKTAAVCVGLGMILTAFTSSIVVLYITYSLLAGIGIGMIYNAVVSVVPLWFPERRGMITGLLLMGYAISTSVLSPVCQFLLSEFGPRRTFLILGIVDMVVFLIGSLFIKVPKEEEQKALPQSSAMAGQMVKNSLNPNEMLHTRTFYLYFMGSNFLVMSALCYLNHVAPALESEFSMPAATVAYVVSAMSLCNGVARPLVGQVFDQFGMKKALLGLSGIYAASAVIACAAFRSGSAALMIVAACGLLFGYGCQGAGLPIVTRTLYGEKYFSMNYSIISLVSLTASIGPSIMGAVQTAEGSYQSGFMMVALFTFISVPLMYVVGKDREPVGRLQYKNQ